MELTDRFPQFSCPVAGIQHRGHRGKTWAKRLTAAGGPHGFIGSWCHAIRRDYDNAGHTGTLYVPLEGIGLYQCHSCGTSTFWELSHDGRDYRLTSISRQEVYRRLKNAGV